MKKTLLSLLMLTSFGIYSSMAQITLYDTDIVGAGDNVEQAQDTIPGAITIGSGGASQTWNFSSISEDVLDTLKFRNPAGYPGAINFPLANLVLLQPEQDSTWIYLTKNTFGLFIVGQALYQQGQLIIIPIAGTIVTFPSTMNTNYSGVWNGTLYSFFVGQDLDGPGPQGTIDSLKVTREADVTSNIDGWGDVTTPFGTFPSLRQVVYEEDIDTTWQLESGVWSIVSPTTVAALGAFGVTVTPIAYDTVRTARWWTNDPSSKFPLVEMDYEGNGTVNNITWQKSTPTVGVHEQAKMVADVSLYPNPAATEITIDVSTTLNNNSIKVFDVTGKLISDYSFIKNKITLSVADLNNGIYFYNIYDVAGNVINSNKFIVAK